MALVLSIESTNFVRIIKVKMMKHFLQKNEMTKNRLRMLTAILTCGIMLTACSKEDNAIADNGNPPAPAAEKELTIIYYGNGGSNLDDYILQNICQMYEADASSYDKVNIVVQYKMSEDIDDEVQYINRIENDVMPGFKFEKGTTYRFAIDPQMARTEQNPQMQFTDDHIYGGKGNTVDLGQADTLRNYMKWAAGHYPAKQYVLVFSDHGGGYMPDDDLPESLTKNTTPRTRGIIYDDGYKSAYGDSHLSVSGLTRAISESGIKPTLIYFDACLMNNLEYLFELKDLTAYVMASTYVTPGEGGSYDSFINTLAKDGISTKAFDEYYDALRAFWSNQHHPEVPVYNDNTVTRTDRLDAVGTTLRAFVDRLIDVYQNGTETERTQIDAITSKAYKIEGSMPYYDIQSFLVRMMSDGEMSNTRLANLAYEAVSALYNADVANTGAQYTYNNYLPGRSVLMAQEGSWVYMRYDWDAAGTRVLVGKIVYTWDGDQFKYKWDSTNQTFDLTDSGKWGSTGTNTYEQLLFDKATGWSRWMKLNKQEPNPESPTTNNDQWDDSYIFDPEY